VLDRALADAELDRKAAFVTNAVKHFKFEPRGKRRLHKRPNAYEIDRCRWWNDLERAIIGPALVVALGATAAWSLLGRTVTISRMRGAVQSLADETPLIVTVHPSYLLRIEDEADKAAEYRRFVADLKLAKKFLAAHAA
jgi:DNA polymerase